MQLYVLKYKMMCGKISPIRRRLYIKREEAFEILKKYNKDEFHIRHALTVEGVMRYSAKELNENVEYWGNIGLLHDVDFELYPEEHCKNGGVYDRENKMD